MRNATELRKRESPRKSPQFSRSIGPQSQTASPPGSTTRHCTSENGVYGHGYTRESLCRARTRAYAGMDIGVSGTGLLRYECIHG